MPPSPSTLTCREMVDVLADYLHGDLATDQRMAFEEHLLGCPDCVAYVRSYRATLQAVREVCRDRDEMPPEMSDAMVRAILEARRAPSGRSRRRR